MGFLDNKKIIIMGVANKSSLAFGCMQAVINQGGQAVSYTHLTLPTN